MLGSSGDLYVIDHQDARMGPFSYDLASLLYDPYATLGDAMIADLYNYYLLGFKAAIITEDICIAREVAVGDERQRVQAEEVHLEEPGLLDLGHRVLSRDRHVLARADPRQRDALEEVAVRDDDAGRVLAGVAVDALELDREVEEPAVRGLVAQLRQGVRAER